MNQPIQQQQQQQQDTADLLGLFSDFSTPSVTTTSQVPNQVKSTPSSYNAGNNFFNGQQPNFFPETNHLQTVKNQLYNESQSVQEIQNQVDQQKDALNKIKQEAEEAERQLEAQRKKKEELTKELQMYKQEIKHYATRIETANQETEKLKKENEQLENEKRSAEQQKQNPVSPLSTAQPLSAPVTGVDHAHDFFSLSGNRPGGQLFAKVEETAPVSTQNTGSTVQSQNKFDPFAGFKATQSAASPTVSLNKLKEDSKRSFSPSPNVDITDIESKFPDLSTMEENFNTPSSPQPPPISSPKKEESVKNDVYASLFSKPSPSPSQSTIKKDPNSKYGFDLSAFEAPSTSASPFESKSTMKDELSSLFSPASTSQPKPNSDFDNIFGSGK